MKRDMELVRKILLKMEEVPMGEAGLIHVANFRHMGYAKQFSMPLSITWEGYVSGHLKA